MNQILLSRRLGLTSPQTLQRVQYARLRDALSPESSIKFEKHVPENDHHTQRAPPTTSTRTLQQSFAADVSRTDDANVVAHSGGVNVLAVDEQSGRYLVSGGADSSIRLWDLNERGSAGAGPFTFNPVATVARSSPGSHVHALTSLSIYPYDPAPSTILTTSYDKKLKLFSIHPDHIAPVHTFDLTDTPYSHSLSQAESGSFSLIAVGTAHPAVKLLDLRTGLTTHTLPGHTGAVFSVAWSPRRGQGHILASGSTDGRVLFFDVRRAHSAFACLDLDDALGVIGTGTEFSHRPDPRYRPRPALDWNVQAHNGPVTGVRWLAGGRKLVTCGHDQRIRVWDAATGRNELVHFGPRIRNSRNSEFAPLPSPIQCGGGGGGDVLFWANDDGKGEIFAMDMNEGIMQIILRTPGIARGGTTASGSSRSTGRTIRNAKTQATAAAAASAAKLTGRGRINAMVWRSLRAESGDGLELYSGHGDGAICLWRGMPPEDEEGEDEDEVPLLEDETERRRKRKRDLLEGLVDGLVGSRNRNPT